MACGQNTGRNPEGRQRASSARDDGASANRVQVQGQYSCQRTTLLLEQPFVFTVSAKCHSFRLGLQYQRPARVPFGSSWRSA